MNPERQESEVSVVEVKYDKRTSALKSNVQRGIISRFCEGNVHDEINQKRVNKWIDECSSDFREIFKYKILNEVGFLDRCEKNPDEVIDEITEELKLRHQFPTVLSEEESKTEELV